MEIYDSIRMQNAEDSPICTVLAKESAKKYRTKQVNKKSQQLQKGLRQDERRTELYGLE